MYIVTGGGGAPLADFENVDLNPYSQVRVKDYHHVTLDFDCADGSLALNAWDRSGERIDGPLMYTDGLSRVNLPLVVRSAVK